MAKLLQLSRPSRRISSVVRTWVALRQQKQRRRQRVAEVTPNAPVVTGSSWAWDRTRADWVDIYLEFSFDHGTLPVATLQIWYRREPTGPRVLLATLPSTAGSYWHENATDEEGLFLYSLRYVDGEVVGPFSDEEGIVPYRAPAAPSILTWSVAWAQVEGVDTATVTVEYEFLGGELPVANLEVWDGQDVGTAVLVGTTPSDGTTWVDPRGFVCEANCYYRMRYVSGALVGPFSAVADVVIVVG